MKYLFLILFITVSSSAFPVEVMIFGSESDQIKCENSSSYFIYPHLKENIDLVVKFSQKELQRLGRIISIGAYQIQINKNKTRILYFDSTPQFKCVKNCLVGRLYRLTIGMNEFKVKSKKDISHIQILLKVKGTRKQLKKSFSFSFIKQGHEILIKKRNFDSLISEQTSVVSKLYHNGQSDEALEITYEDYISDESSKEKESSTERSLSAEIAQGSSVGLILMSADTYDRAGGGGAGGGILKNFYPMPNTKDIFSMGNLYSKGFAISFFVNTAKTNSLIMDLEKTLSTKSTFTLLPEESGVIVEVLTLIDSKFSKYSANECGFLSKNGEISVIERLKHYEMNLVEPDKY
ncbi:MAG: hypothetical protein HOE90_10060 [Bacteriovoracaceae bacterium]|jgi:hypothetical protein|nr:hypothetical protein [Bacteriovoracaceae bacterium]